MYTEHAISGRRRRLGEEHRESVQTNGVLSPWPLFRCAFRSPPVQFGVRMRVRARVRPSLKFPSHLIIALVNILWSSRQYAREVRTRRHVYIQLKRKRRERPYVIRWLLTNCLTCVYMLVQSTSHLFFCSIAHLYLNTHYSPFLLLRRRPCVLKGFTPAARARLGRRAESARARAEVIGDEKSVSVR